MRDFKAFTLIFLIALTPIFAFGAPSLQPVVIVNLGHGTCPADWQPLQDPQSKLLKAKITKQVQTLFSTRLEYPVTTVLSCFSHEERDLDGSPTYPTYHATFRWVVVGASETEGSIQFKIHEQDLTSKDLLRIFEPYFQFVTDLTRDRPTLVASHSWGAWLGFHTALRTQADGLITLDAIEPVACKPSALITTGIFTLGHNSPAGCQRSPNYPEEDIAALSHTLRFWHNYYQTDFKLLHGSRLPASVIPTPSLTDVRDMRLVYPTDSQGLLGFQHRNISNYQGIWEAVKNFGLAI